MANLLNPMLMGPAQSMRPPVLPAAQPMAAPSPFGGVGARLRGLLAPEVALPMAGAMMMGRTPGESFGNAFMLGGQALGEQRQQNATRAGLAKLGLSEPEIDAAMNNPAMLTHYLKQISDKTGLGQTAPSNVREWEYFNSLPKDDQARYLRMKRANPYLDVGTGFVQPDPVNPGQVAGGPIVKENYQERFDQAQGQAEGKAQGEASAQLPGDLLTAEQTISEIDQLIKHPGLSAIVGPLDQYRSGIALGNEGRDALARYKQLTGRAFLQAYALLKGGGTITEIEGVKAEQAMARMDRAQGEAEFRAALKDLRDAVEAGVQKLRQRAGQPVTASPGAPATGNRTSSGVQWSID